LDTKYNDQMSGVKLWSYRGNQRKIVDRCRCCVLRPLSKAATSPSAGSMAIAKARMTRVTKGRAISPRLGQPVAGGTGRWETPKCPLWWICCHACRAYWRPRTPQTASTYRRATSTCCCPSSPVAVTYYFNNIILYNIICCMYQKFNVLQLKILFVLKLWKNSIFQLSTVDL